MTKGFAGTGPSAPGALLGTGTRGFPGAAAASSEQLHSLHSLQCSSCENREAATFYTGQIRISLNWVGVGES